MAIPRLAFAVDSIFIFDIHVFARSDTDRDVEIVDHPKPTNHVDIVVIVPMFTMGYFDVIASLNYLQVPLRKTELDKVSITLHRLYYTHVTDVDAFSRSYTTLVSSITRDPRRNS